MGFVAVGRAAAEATFRIASHLSFSNLLHFYPTTKLFLLHLKFSLYSLFKGPFSHFYNFLLLFILSPFISII